MVLVGMAVVALLLLAERRLGMSEEQEDARRETDSKV